MVSVIMIRNPVLFLSLKLIYLVTLTIAQPSFLYHFCDTNGNGYNYTSNSTYRINLDTVLSSLTSTSNTSYGFYNLSSGGQEPDIVHAIALCRGDIEPSICRSCVNDSIVLLRQRCPNQKDAIGWYENCMLRYSNATILNNMYTRPGATVWNVNNATNVVEFSRLLQQLMDRLRWEAASGGSDRKFASGNTTGPDFSNIYGLLQCTPDLSQQQCYDCLEDASNSIPFGKIAAKILRPSCTLGFDIGRFFNDTPVIAPPPPSLSPTLPLSPPPPSLPGKSSSSTETAIAVIVPTVSCVMLIAVVCIIMKGKRKESMRRQKFESKDDVSTIESLQYDFGTVRAATDDFSKKNKLGKGGFGFVYKGRLQNGQEIAVKRLSRSGGQGELEFKNEVLLMAKLQHRNLVRLLGFSYEGTERLLIYEFMPNASLDYFLFNPTKSANLDWDRRYKILIQVARGLLYLHEDSRLRIVHRDLKASNVLLDGQMNAKIADFGMARLFKLDETHGTASQIAGTLGYMPPEYVMYGQFSAKSDVFSFGVLILEIVTGQKNQNFRIGDSEEHLLSYAWKSWKERTTFNMIDPALRAVSGSLDLIIMRMTHIGLLCVQEKVVDRPDMASVLLMLDSTSITLVAPSEPGFFVYSRNVARMAPLEDNKRRRHSRQPIHTSTSASINDVTISELSAR